MTRKITPVRSHGWQSAAKEKQGVPIMTTELPEVKPAQFETARFEIVEQIWSHDHSYPAAK